MTTDVSTLEPDGLQLFKQAIFSVVENFLTLPILLWQAAVLPLILQLEAVLMGSLR